MSRTRHVRDIVILSDLSLSLSDVCYPIFPLKHLAVVSVIFLSAYEQYRFSQRSNHCDRVETALNGVGKAPWPNGNKLITIR